MTVIKICGITNITDALCAVEAGADLLGFIFHPKSPRFVQPANVALIVNALHEQKAPVITVGVFVNEIRDQILQTLSQTGLDLAQLSGDESSEALHALAGRAYKAVRTIEAANSVLNDHTPGNLQLPDLLLDANHPTLYGGSGYRADNGIAREISSRCRLLLAGGLNPENVADAVLQIHPWGVDVASGVEASPGTKDHAKVRAFVRTVRQLDRLQVR